MSDQSQRLFLANLPPKSINEMADWLDTPEGREWFFHPITGFDENGEPIRGEMSANCITVGKIDASMIRATCLRCGSDHGCECGYPAEDAR